MFGKKRAQDISEIKATKSDNFKQARLKLLNEETNQITHPHHPPDQQKHRNNETQQTLTSSHLVITLINLPIRPIRILTVRRELPLLNVVIQVENH